MAIAFSTTLLIDASLASVEEALPLALTEIDGHRNALITGQLNRLDIAFTHADTDPLIDTGTYLAGISS